MSQTDLAVFFPEASRRGGVERVVWDVMSYMARRHIVVFVGETTPDGLPEDVGLARVDVTRALPSSVRPFAFRASAKRLANRIKPKVSLSLGAVSPPGDVLWVQSVHRAWLRCGRPVPVGRVQVPPQARYLMARHLVLLEMERQYFTRSRPRAVICTSQREVDDLADLYGVDSRIMHVIPNSFDPQLFNLGRRTALRTAVRMELGLADGDVALFFVANELHRKGFAQTLHAMALLDDPRFTLHVIGRASPENYARLIDRLRLRDKIRYHGATNDVGRWYAGADLLVLPTQYEPFGLVIVEALASGVPVITTRLAGASSAIAPGATGLLQEDPYDVEELADLIGTAASADLDRWSVDAAAAVDAYRRDSVMARVEDILFPNPSLAER